MSINLIEFEIRAIEDRNLTLETGHLGVIEKEFCKITVRGGNLSVDKEITDNQLKEWRLDPSRKYIYEQYVAWKEGKESPINGFPLTEWPAISIGMVTALAKIRVRSVEELADIQDDFLPKVGQPGTRAIRDKAREWLKVSANQGKIVEQITSMQLVIDDVVEKNKKLQIENEALKMMQAEKKKVK